VSEVSKQCDSFFDSATIISQLLLS